MNFSAYIERQKQLIRERHEGDLYLMHKGEAIPLIEDDKLFIELNGCKGLNTFERMGYVKAG